jgi:putative ATP-binding cassette transporter
MTRHPKQTITLMNGSEPIAGTLLWIRIRRALSEFVTSESGGMAKWLFALLIACMLSINALNVVNSYVGRDFISSVESRDMPRFMWVSLVYVLVFGVCTVVAVFYRFVEERLALLWREWQTRRLLGRYLANRAYLRLASGGEVGNPDQRIAEDVRNFAVFSLSIFLMTLNAVFTVIAFSGVMWSISPWLFVGGVVYGALGTLVTILLGSRLVGLNSRQSDKEAVFRSELLQVRENAEVMALLHREGQTAERLSDRFDEIVANAQRVISVNRNVSFFTTGYNYLIPVIPVFVVAHLFMWGQVEFGVITQSSMAFAQLMGAFSLIITQFQSLSSYAAVANRIRVLSEALDIAAADRDGPIRLLPDEKRLVCENLSLKAPDGRSLVQNLTFEVPAVSRLLVRAEDHRAGRVFFRALAGLGANGEGLILRPQATQFLAESPYLPESSLQSLLSSDGQSASATLAEMEEALETLGLSNMSLRCGGWEQTRPWNEELSLDEQALLAVARALLAKPMMVVIDHPSATLDRDRQRLVVAALAARGIGCVSLGRDDSEAAPFDLVLRITKDGAWFWEESQD